MRAGKKSGRGPGLATRRKIVNTLGRLFYTRGYPDTGVAEITEEAGVTKPTLYHHFSSKEEMGVAYLRHQEEVYFASYDDWARRSRSLGAFLNMWVAVTHKKVREGNFFGCPFVRFSGQISHDETPAMRAALRKIEDRWFALLAEFIDRLIREKKIKADTNAERTAREILTIFQGATMLYVLSRDKAYLDSLRRQFRDLCARAAR